MINHSTAFGDRTVRDGLIAIWRQIFQTDDIDDDSDWYELRGGLRSPVLFDAINAKFGTDLPVPVLYRDSRLADLAETVQRGHAPDFINRLIPLRSGQNPPAIGYVPGVFGEDLHALADLRALDHPVYFLRAPGLDDGDEVRRTLPELARFYLDALLPVAGDQPLLLAGYSAGGTIAIEMANLGARRGWSPLGVVLIDTLPPFDSFADLDEDNLMALQLQVMLDKQGERCGAEPPQCFGLEIDDELVAEVTAYFHEHDAGELPRGVAWPYLERRLRVYASGLLAANSHQPGSCDVPVYYLRTSESRDFGVSWESATTTGKYEMLDVDSTHSSLWYDKVVTAALAGFLEQSRNTASERTGL